jgi:hypothetical protein
MFVVIRQSRFSPLVKWVGLEIEGFILQITAVSSTIFGIDILRAGCYTFLEL